MQEQIDRWTTRLRAAINIILISDPLRTSLGVLLGIAINVVAKVFEPLLSKFSSAIDLSRVTLLEYVLFGVAVLHIPTFHFYMFKKGHLLSENEERAFMMIRKAKEDGVPSWRLERMYMDLCERALANVTLNHAVQQEIRDYQRLERQ